MPHVDPPVNFSHMGWGTPDLQHRQNLAIERATIEGLAARSKSIVQAKDAQPVSAMLPLIEQKLRALMMFDEGWAFWIAEQLVYGEDLMVPQNMGNCVGDSHCCLLASRIAHEVLAEGEAEDPLGAGSLAVPFIPYSYGAGRMAGNMLGGGDGSYCGAQIEGTQENGFLPCYTSGLDSYSGSLPQCDSSVGRLFGRSKSEIMKWRPKAVEFDLIEAPRCKSADEAIDLVVNKKIPLQICSGWGFAYWKYDATYDLHLYRPSGSWSHSIQIIAIIKIKGMWFAVIRNQWGRDAHKGSPERKIPGGSFVIPIETLDKWIKDAEVIGIGELKGLPANPGF